MLNVTGLHFFHTQIDPFHLSLLNESRYFVWTIMWQMRFRKTASGKRVNMKISKKLFYLQDEMYILFPAKHGTFLFYFVT